MCCFTMQKEIMSTTCAGRCFFNVIIIGMWLTTDGKMEEPRVSSHKESTFQCDRSQHIELISYRILPKNNPQSSGNLPISFEEELYFHKACSRQWMCMKPTGRNYNMGIEVNYRCIDRLKMKNMCETWADSFSSVDIFYDGKFPKIAQNCKCSIKGGFKLFVVDMRLLNKEDKCSRSYINIQKLEDCKNRNCLNVNYSCSRVDKSGVIYQTLVHVGKAKIDVSIEHLNTPPQMVWLSIVSQESTEINCEAYSVDTTSPVLVNSEGSTESSAAKTDTFGDDGPNALVVAVPVLALLLLVAAGIIGFLLYRRNLQRSQSVKKERNDSSTGKTVSDIEIATNLSASAAKEVSGDNFLETNQRLSVLNEYSSIQDINKDAGVLPTMDEGYYTIKDKEKNEYNVLSLNTPQIPKDPNYGHITEVGSDKLSSACNHLYNKEHVSKDEVSSRPKLEVPVDGYHSETNVENKIQSTATATVEPISLSPENTNTLEDHPDGYSHLVKDCKNASESQTQGSAFKKQKQTGETEIDNDAHGYFVLEQAKSVPSTDDMISTPFDQYFVLEKMPFADKEVSEQTMKRTGETLDKKQRKETNDQDIVAESEYFEMQKNGQSPDQSHVYTTLENPVSNKKSIKASNDQSLAEKDKAPVERFVKGNHELEVFSELEYFKTKNDDQQPGDSCDNADLDKHTSIVKEEENQHDYFVLYKQA